MAGAVVPIGKDILDLTILPAAAGLINNMFVTAFVTGLKLQLDANFRVGVGADAKTGTCGTPAQNGSGDGQDDGGSLGPVAIPGPKDTGLGKSGTTRIEQQQPTPPVAGGPLMPGAPTDIGPTQTPQVAPSCCTIDEKKISVTGHRSGVVVFFLTIRGKVSVKVSGTVLFIPGPQTIRPDPTDPTRTEKLENSVTYVSQCKPPACKDDKLIITVPYSLKLKLGFEVIVGRLPTAGTSPGTTGSTTPSGTTPPAGAAPSAATPAASDQPDDDGIVMTLTSFLNFLGTGFGLDLAVISQANVPLTCDVQQQ